MLQKNFARNLRVLLPIRWGSEVIQIMYESWRRENQERDGNKRFVLTKDNPLGAVGDSAPSHPGLDLRDDAPTVGDEDVFQTGSSKNLTLDSFYVDCIPGDLLEMDFTMDRNGHFVLGLPDSYAVLNAELKARLLSLDARR